MIIDADNGEVLHAVNADARNYPASLTKMMTLYLLFDRLDAGEVHLNDRIPISAHAAGMAPSKLGLRPGQSIRVEDAILALCTKSANDIAAAVGEFLGGSEPAFAQMMTRKAAELGMRQTQFRNASGLPNLAQFSTARDMATLARALIHTHARYYHYFSTRTFSYNGEEIRNHNHLMEWYQGADGIKTGFIAASGFNLVASAKRNGRRLIGVVFGGQSAPARDRHMAHLLDAAFARAPGTTGVEMASLEADDDMAKTARTEGRGADYRAVMKAMAAAKAARASAAAAPKRHARPVETGDTEDEEDWGIQVGAFAQKTSAHSAAATAQHKLGKLAADGDIEAVRTKSGKHTLYRARVTGLSEEDAREACRRLAKTRTACSVVATGASLAQR